MTSQVSAPAGPNAAAQTGGAPSGCASPEVPLERIEADICRLAARLAAGTCELIMLIAEFDRREGWRSWGCRSTAHWLSWRAGLGLGTAREHVRVGRALADLPTIRSEFQAGRLSYSKVRAITRVALPETDADLARTAMAGTAAHVERIVRGCRSSDRADDPSARRARHGVRWRHDDDGALVLTARLAPEDGAIVIAALRAAGAGHDARAGVTPPPTGQRGDPGPGDGPAPDVPQRPLVDALVDMAAASLAGQSPAVREAHQVFVNIDADLLRGDPAEPLRGQAAGREASDAEVSGGDAAPGETSPGHAESRRVARPRGTCRLEGGPGLDPETVRRLSCDAPVAALVLGRPLTSGERPGSARSDRLSAGARLRAVDVGRTHRYPPPKMRRLLLIRDHGACAFPGCGQTRHLHAHHVKHWAKGGVTALSNLVMLCRAHHWAVHEGGYRITTVGDQVFQFHRPDGVPIEQAPQPPPLTVEELRWLSDQLDSDVGGNASSSGSGHATGDDRDALLADWDGHGLDLGYAVSCLLETRNHALRHRRDGGAPTPPDGHSPGRPLRRGSALPAVSRGN